MDRALALPGRPPIAHGRLFTPPRTPMFNRLSLLALALALPLAACANDEPDAVDTDVIIEDVDPSIGAAADDAADAANAAADAAGDAAAAAGDAAASAGAAATDAMGDATDAMEAEVDTMGNDM